MTRTVIATLLAAFLVLGCDGLNNASDDDNGATILAGADFFPSTPGYGVRYRCTDTHSTRNFDGDVWAVAQKEEVDPALDRSYGLIQTFTDIGSGTGSYTSSTMAAAERTFTDGLSLFYYGAGVPVGNQAHYPRILAALPATFSGGVTFTVDWNLYGAVDYTVTLLGEYTADGTTFQGTVRVDADVPAPDGDDPYYTGSGYAILAPGVGIVESSFTRDDGSMNSYVYQETQNLGLNTISGTVTTDGTTPAEDYVIAMSTYNITSWDVADSSGNFSFEAYGPDVPVFIGKDDDGDSSIDYDNPTSDYPKRYTIPNITGDTTGVTIDLSGI